MTPLKRRRLGRWGTHGDSVRAVEDVKADAVFVHYRDRDGVAHKKRFPRDASGRRAAVAWGEAYQRTRDVMSAEGAPRLSVRALWDLYAAAPAFQSLADATQRNYPQGWRRWERFVGRDHIADDTTLHHVDRFLTATIAAGIAPNQARSAINVARIVYTWGQSRKLVRQNELALYRWRMPKGGVVLAPEEYTDDEFTRLLTALDPQDGRQWRPWVALMLAGHHGQRARAVRSLRWADVDLEQGEIVWPAEYQKNRKELVQPLTDEGRSALLTALDWRARTGYAGPWVLFAGGGNRRLGAASGYGAGGIKRRERTEATDVPMTYGGLWTALRKAEVRAGVVHRPYRALHGFRRMAAGNVADATGDGRLGLEWIGDDPRMASKYLRPRDERMERAAAGASTMTREDR